MELQNTSVTKGSGITHFCHEHNIPFSSVIAFGDAENDIEMLKCAGWSVCLKNGMDDVKAITDDITEYTSSEDGVGKYLFQHILDKTGEKNEEDTIFNASWTNII